MIKDCEGCSTFSADFGECKITNFGVKDMRKCPCKKCLVKVICIAACKDFDFARKENNCFYNLIERRNK